MSDKEIILIDSENDEDTNEEKFNIFEGMEKLWIIKNNISTEKIVKRKKIKGYAIENVKNQLSNFNKKINKKLTILHLKTLKIMKK